MFENYLGYESVIQEGAFCEKKLQQSKILCKCTLKGQEISLPLFLATKVEKINPAQKVMSFKQVVKCKDTVAEKINGATSHNHFPLCSYITFRLHFPPSKLILASCFHFCIKNLISHYKQFFAFYIVPMISIIKCYLIGLQ